MVWAPVTVTTAAEVDSASAESVGDEQRVDEALEAPIGRVKAWPRLPMAMGAVSRPPTILLFRRGMDCRLARGS